MKVDARFSVTALVAAAAFAFTAKFVTRALLGEPAPPGPAEDHRAPGEPIPPGLTSPEEGASDSWEDKVFEFGGFAPEIASREAVVRPLESLAAVPGPEMGVVGGRAGVPGFSIDRTEVTFGAYRDFLRAKGRAGPTLPDPWAAPYAWRGADFPPGLDAHPVVLVTPQEAAEFCAFVGKRLPTELEWERAGRGDDDRLYPWGQVWDSTRTNVVSRRSGPLRTKADWRAFASSYTSSGVESRPVATMPGDISPYGVMDMGGNVSEWVTGAAQVAGETEPLAVAKGNAWGNRDYSSPLWNRYPFPNEHRDVLVGFRCAR